MVFVQTHRKPSLTFWYECITFSLTRQTSFRWLKQFAMARFNFYANFIQGHTSFVLAHASKKFLCSNFIQIMTKGLDPSTFRMGNISASLKRLRTFSYTDTKSISPKWNADTSGKDYHKILFYIKILQHEIGSKDVLVIIEKCNLTPKLVRWKTILAKERWMMVMFEFWSEGFNYIYGDDVWMCENATSINSKDKANLTFKTTETSFCILARFSFWKDNQRIIYECIISSLY